MGFSQIPGVLVNKTLGFTGFDVRMLKRLKRKAEVSFLLNDTVK